MRGVNELTCLSDTIFCYCSSSTKMPLLKISSSMIPYCEGKVRSSRLPVVWLALVYWVLFVCFQWSLCDSLLTSVTKKRQLHHSLSYSGFLKILMTARKLLPTCLDSSLDPVVQKVQTGYAEFKGNSGFCCMSCMEPAMNIISSLPLLTCRSMSADAVCHWFRVSSSCWVCSWSCLCAFYKFQCNHWSYLCSKTYPSYALPELWWVLPLHSGSTSSR